MNTAIHPTYFEAAQIRCACGNALSVGSTVEEIHVELCSQCHPFYTGKQKILDTAGRVERFAQRRNQKQAAAAARKGRKVKREKTSVRKESKKKETAA